MKGKWKRIEGARGAFEYTVGRTIVRRTDQSDDCPKGLERYWGEEFEAVEFDDGSWLAIEYSPGEQGYSSWTPGSPGYCYVFVFTPSKS